MRLLAFLLVFLSVPALAYHEGHDGIAPEIQAWFARQKQPDSDPVHPASCCGDYDAYEADLFEKNGDQFVAIITNGKDDIPAGTRVIIPPQKMPQDNHDPNPSGHGIVFMSIYRDADNVAHPGVVYCYFYPFLG